MTPPLEPTRPSLKRLKNLSWNAVLAVVSVAFVVQLGLLALAIWRPGRSNAWVAVALIGLAGTLAAWLVLGWFAGQMTQQRRTAAELRDAYAKLAETHRQLLAVHDIGKEIASAADIQQVLELAARAPSHLAGAQGSAVIVFDEKQEHLRLEMAWGLSNAYVTGFRQRIELGIPAERCQKCSTLHAQVSGDCPLFNGMQSLAASEGIRSLACVPLIREQRREGILTAYFPSPEGPPEQQVQLLNIVATEIAAALDSVRLRQQQMATLYAVEGLMRDEQNLDEMLEQVLHISLSGWNVSHGAILLWNQAEETWTHWVQVHPDQNGSRAFFDLVLRLAEQVRQDQHPVMIPDLTKQPRLLPQNTAGFGSAGADVLVSGGNILGALVMIAQPRGRFGPAQAPFFSAIAHQAALAISNAQLHAQVQQLAILDERYRLSREIHDGLAQTLGSLGWQLDHLDLLLESGDVRAARDVLAGTRQATREAYMDVREAIDGLRLAADHASGLASVLAEYVEDFEDRSGIETAFQASAPVTPVTVAPEAELQLLRIAQEGLTNVRKHASARHAWVTLQVGIDQIELTVADDGRGFDPRLPRGRQHVGLAGMRERAHTLGGTVTLATSPGQGTRLTVTVPLHATRSNVALEPADKTPEPAAI